MDDLISRKHLMDKLRKTPRYFAVKEDIEEEPAVDAEKIVYSHWEYDDDKYFGFDSPEWTCANCGQKVGEGMNTRTPTNRCPNCGARMKEVTENGAD